MWTSSGLAERQAHLEEGRWHCPQRLGVVARVADQLAAVVAQVDRSPDHHGVLALRCRRLLDGMESNGGRGPGQDLGHPAGHLGVWPSDVA